MARLTARLALVSLALLAGHGRATDTDAAARAAFIEAYRAAEAGEALPAGIEELAGYPLYRYLQAARLRAAFRDAPRGAVDLPADVDARAFLESHGAEPAGRMVRAAWLASLAERRRWAGFLDVYAGARATDQTLRCQAATARIALGDTEGLAEAAVREWLTPDSAPDACDPVFDWLRRSGRLDADLIEQRARLALAAGESRLARWLSRSLPAERARPLRDWVTLIDRPLSSIDAVMRSPGVAVEPEALLDGWTRLARRDPYAARERYEDLVAALDLDEADASPYARALALGLAWSRRPALGYFARVAPEDFDPLAHEWHARAALWAGDWPATVRAIEAMPAAMRDEARWRYWLARALERGGDVGRAGELYRSTILTDNWYAVLSAARLDRPFEPHPVAMEYDPQRVARLERLPAFVRAHELLEAGLHELAPAEWRAGFEPLDAGGRRAAVVVAHGWAWYFQSIAAAAQMQIFDDYELLYPRPHAREVASAARASGLPETLIYAVMRQESLFQPYAVSSAGAVGLMQLLPSTARQTAAVMGRPRPGPASLREPAVNLPLGSGHLARLVDRFDGQVVLALAAYNAGTAAARRWLPDEPMEVDVWVENIPFNETRGYVQRVLWHSVVFEWLADGEPEDATGWLTEVRRPAS